MSGIRSADADAAADTVRSARLHWATDSAPGIRRVRRGRGFSYVAPDGSAVADASELARIRRLAVPPAWTDVWISPDPDGHVQAVGRDARGRKQYRYHERWLEVRDTAKYDRLLDFAAALPRLRARIDREMRRPGLPREKVVATVVHLLDATSLRVGSTEYARENRSFGLTTLAERHVDVAGNTVHFQFRGKGGKDVAVDLRDARVARVIRRCEELPGQELFQYLDEDGQRRVVRSDDVNDWLRAVTGADFSAKDFRTWAGTVLAVAALRDADAPPSVREARRVFSEAIRGVAAALGNTPAVCRRCYVHPRVAEVQLEGGVASVIGADRRPRPRRGLSSDEAAALALISRRRASGQRRKRG